MLWVKKNHLFLRFASQAEVGLTSHSPGELQQLQHLHENLQFGGFWPRFAGGAAPIPPQPSPWERTLRSSTGSGVSPGLPLFCLSQQISQSPIPRYSGRVWRGAGPAPGPAADAPSGLQLAHRSCNCNSLNHHTAPCADIS